MSVYEMGMALGKAAATQGRKEHKCPEGKYWDGERCRYRHHHYGGFIGRIRRKHRNGKKNGHQQPPSNGNGNGGAGNGGAGNGGMGNGGAGGGNGGGI